MSGVAGVVEDVTGQHKQQRKARHERDIGYQRALGETAATAELGQAFTEFGAQSLEKLMNLIENPESITEMPGYEFRKEEGLAGVERGAAAKGKLFSGQAMKELSRYASDYASKERGVEITRLAGLAEMGLASGAKTSAMRANLQIGRMEARAGSRERAVVQQTQHGQVIGSSISSGFGGTSGPQKTTEPTGDELTGQEIKSGWGGGARLSSQSGAFASEKKTLT